MMFHTTCNVFLGSVWGISSPQCGGVDSGQHISHVARGLFGGAVWVRGLPPGAELLHGGGRCSGYV